jgi:hypothetical protein
VSILALHGAGRRAAGGYLIRRLNRPHPEYGRDNDALDLHFPHRLAFRLLASLIHSWRVAFKLMMWSWKLGRERRGGLTTPQFVRAGLMRLEMGEDLTHIVRGGTARPIAPTEQVLALQAQT